MKPGTQADVVREFGCSREAISKLTKKKDYRIIHTPGGKIDVDATVKALKDSGFGKRSRAIKKRAAVSEKKTTSEKVPASAGQCRPDESDKPPTQKEVEENPLKPTDERNKIDRYLTFQKYEKERIANERAKKELVNFSEISEAVFKFLRPFRDDIQAISERVAGTARLAKSKHEAEKIVKEETDRILLSRIGNEYSFDDRLKKKIIEILKR